MIQEREQQGWFIFERDGDTSQGVTYAHLPGGKNLEGGYDIRDRGVQGTPGND